MHGQSELKRISSRQTFFLKNVFPVFWFGFLFLLLMLPMIGARTNIRKELGFMVVPILLAVFGSFIMKKMVWTLADEVYDCGDFLLVRNRGEEENVALSNIMNVSATTFINPPRITLRLVTPGKFGQEIAFSPIRPFTLNPAAKDPVSEDLIVRVDQARSKRVQFG